MTRVLVLCAAVAASRLALGGEITLNDFSGGETLVDFTDGLFPSGNGPTTYHGITFTNSGSGTGGPGMDGNSDWGGFFSNIPGSSQGLAFDDGWGNSDLQLDFPNGTQRAGLLLSTGLQTLYAIDAYGPGNTFLGTAQGAMPGGVEAVFLGWEDAGGISYLRIYEPNGENAQITIIDDIRHEAIPAPAAAALLGLGGLAAGRRRR